MDITTNSVEFPRNSLICLTCRIMFEKAEVRKEHYKSEWHRFNLHRKVANLTSVTFDEFKKLTEVIKVNEVKQNINCNICRKKFNNKKQYENHIKSKKHKQKMKEKSTVMSNTENKTNTTMHNETEMDTLHALNASNVSDTSDTWDTLSDSSDLLDELDESNSSDTYINPIKHKTCLFCDQTSRSLMRNLKHMMIKHSFFVPDIEHCINMRGLLIYIGYKIYSEFKCIWCDNSGKQFQSLEAAQAHMIDKGHCKIPFEGEALLEYSQFYNYSSSDLDAEQLALAEPSENFSECEGFEMVLPSGKIIGHRTLMRYYKQNLSSSRAIATNGKKLMSHYVTLKPEQEEEAKKRRIQDTRHVQRTQSKYSTQLQFKKNKLQTHFRVQTNLF